LSLKINVGKPTVKVGEGNGQRREESQQKEEFEC
jgi:hypothetical protein